MNRISIIMPAYNEEKRIGRTLEAYSNFFNNLADKKILGYEILVVINNTKDRTEQIVKKWQNKNNRIKYLNFKRGGKGFAVIEGFKDALKRDNDLIGFVDADLATNPEEFYKLIHFIGNFDGAIACRYMKGAIIEPKPTIQRIIAKRLFNILVRVILFVHYKDTQCGAKLFRRRALEKSLKYISMSQWAFDVDLLYTIKKAGYSIKEIPTKWHDKEYSKINFWRAGPLMALGVIRLRILNSPFRGFINIYDKLIKFILK